MLKRLILLSAVTLLMVPQVYAQGFSIGPEAGYHKSEDGEGDLMFGAAARVKLSSALGAEAAIQYRQEDRDLGSGSVTIRNYPILVSGLIYPLPIAYGVVGAGWYNTKFEFENLQGVEDGTTQEFGWHFGAGIELPVGGSKLFGDIRYVFIDYDFGNVPSTGDSNFYIISAGFLFGL